MSLLALTSPPESNPHFRHPHDFSSSSRSFNASTSSQQPPAGEMTSNPHRGLPPPGAIGLPDPTRPAPPPPLPLTSLPAPPAQWHGAEDSMRAWLAAKMEDDKRRQEELKLEQRRLEERMLHDAYQSSVPPHLIPVIFAGLSGGPLASASLDIAQQHLAQMQHPPQYAPPAQTSPDMRQDPRMAAQPQYLPAQPAPPPPPPQQPSHHHHQQLPPSQAAPGQAMPPQSAYPAPAYQSSPQGRSKPLYGPPIQQYAPHTASAAAAAGQGQSGLPRLSTHDAGPQPLPGYGQQQEHNSPSPNIYFHHWQPPAPNAKEIKDAGKPPTNPPWRISGQDFSSSPRGKRKATGSHEPRGPPPTSNPAAATSPTYSAGSSASAKSHRRQRSRDSPAGQRRAYDVIERRNRREDRESGSRDNSTSGRSDPASRHQTPREPEEDSKERIPADT